MPKSNTENKKNIILITKGAQSICPIKNLLAKESVVILLRETIVQRSGKFQLSPTFTRLIITEYNINKNLR